MLKLVKNFWFWVFTLSISIALLFIYKPWAKKSHFVGVRKGPLVEAVYGLGSVIPEETFEAKVALNRILEKLYVKAGDTVVEGQELLKYDEGPVVRAPFKGTVTELRYKEKEIVSPQMAVLKLMNMDKKFLEVSLEQQAALRVKSGQKAVISFESLRNEKFEGVVESVYPKESSFIVRINIQKFPESVLPGMTADVALEVGRKENVLSIPVKAVNSGRAIVLRNESKVKVNLELGIMDGEWIEVLSGLEADDQVLVKD